MLQIALIRPWALEVSDTGESQQCLCFSSLCSHKVMCSKCGSGTEVSFRLVLAWTHVPGTSQYVGCWTQTLRHCRRNASYNISIVWQLTKAEEKATGAPESRKDECSANSAPSGGAPDLFERTSNLIRSQGAYLFS